MEHLIAPTINLAMLIALLFYYLRAPLKTFIQTRHSSIRDEVHSVREQLKVAKEKYDEFSAKLKAIDTELAALRQQAKADAKVAKERMATEAKRLSETVILDAKASANVLFSEVKDKLYFELSSRVLERAETLLRDRVTTDDRARIRQEFSMQVNAEVSQ